MDCVGSLGTGGNPDKRGLAVEMWGRDRQNFIPVSRNRMRELECNSCPRLLNFDKEAVSFFLNIQVCTGAGL